MKRLHWRDEIRQPLSTELLWVAERSPEFREQTIAWRRESFRRWRRQAVLTVVAGIPSILCFVACVVLTADSAECFAWALVATVCAMFDAGSYSDAVELAELRRGQILQLGGTP